MRLIMSLLLCLSLFGCTPTRKHRKLPVYKRTETSQQSVFTLSAPADDLKGIQKYVGDGNNLSLQKSMHFDFGSTKVDLPAGTNASIANSDSAVAIVFNAPKPVVTTKLFGLSIHPNLERLLIKPDGTIDAFAKEFGKTVEKKAVVRWEANTVAAEPDAADSRPTMWAWDMENCVACTTAKNAFKEAKKLPYQVVWNPSGVDAPFTLRPCFAWSKDDVPDTEMKYNWKQKGWPGLEQLNKEFAKREQKAAANLAPWHSHTCPSRHCGYTWSHYDGDPNASHNCPKCGRYQNIQSGRG